ncbi:MAG: PAS domain-containing sensor histidine kinase [Myxococcales bacterium]|nr:PAS domain-containing sensor histidine kinase [Myxococcales bacterium]
MRSDETQDSPVPRSSEETTSVRGVALFGGSQLALRLEKVLQVIVTAADGPFDSFEDGTLLVFDARTAQGSEALLRWLHQEGQLARWPCLTVARERHQQRDLHRQGASVVVLEEEIPDDSHLRLRLDDAVDRWNAAARRLVGSDEGNRVTSTLVRSWIEQLPLPMALFSPEEPFAVLAHNQAYHSIAGVLHLSQGVGSAVSSHVPGSKASSALEAFREVSRSAVTRSVDVLFHGGQDETISWCWNISPVQSRGEVMAIAAVAVDASPLVEVRRTLEAEVSRRTDMERSLRQTEVEFRDVVNGLPLLVWQHDVHGCLEMVNDPFFEYFGVTEHQLKELRWEDLVHPEDAAYLDEFAAYVREQRPFHAKARVKTATDEWRWLESWARPRFAANQEFEGFIGTSADVTARTQTEIALRESEERFRTMADNISQLAWMTDSAGCVTWYNKRWFDYTGTTLEDVEGWKWMTVHHPEHLDRVVEKVSRCFETGESWEDLFPLRGADGNYRWFLSRALPIRDEHGRIVRWFGTNTDVTDQRDISERLREADRRKDEYLAMLGHELRNPLAAVQSATELLTLQRSDPVEVEKARSVLSRQSRHMARLIDDLLEASRIARGKINVQLQQVDLRSILYGSVEALGTTILERELELVVDLGAGPLWVTADPVRLAQIFDNILANAVKFTKAPGRIWVKSHKVGAHIETRIGDTGIGLRPEVLRSIFEPFRQEPQGHTDSSAGLGLGLALAKGLTEIQSGSIEATSAGLGRGSEFLVRFPEADPPVDAPPRAEAPAKEPHRHPPKGPHRRRQRRRCRDAEPRPRADGLRRRRCRQWKRSPRCLGGERGRRRAV